MKKKHDLAALLIAKPEGAAEEEHTEEEMGMDEAKTAASEELLAAFEAKDAGGVANALDAFVKACYAEHDEGEE